MYVVTKWHMYSLPDCNEAVLSWQVDWVASDNLLNETKTYIQLEDSHTILTELHLWGAIALLLSLWKSKAPSLHEITYFSCTTWWSLSTTATLSCSISLLATWSCMWDSAYYTCISRMTTVNIFNYISLLPTVSTSVESLSPVAGLTTVVLEMPSLLSLSPPML